ncbi:MAG: DUF86 domain-containing protein [Pseudanabaena sp. M151S2SP2A07QC]|nr:DUF86 domain-containing protein [Pseudanabaena sp. M151S2SP2A07QC]
MAVSKIRVMSKLDFIEENLEDLKNFQDISLEEYLSNRHTQKIVERTLEIIFQAAIDANRHVLKEGFQIVIGEYREGFTEMGKLKVLSEDLAKTLEDSAGMRNVLAHLYDKLDSRVVYRAIKMTLHDYPIYQEQILTYLETLEDKNNG